MNRLRRCRVPVGMICGALSAVALGAAPASAALPVEVTEAAKSVATPVTAPIAQSLPQAGQPSIPAAAPTAPQNPVKLPAETTPPARDATAAATVTPVENAAKQVTSATDSGGGSTRQSGDGTNASASDASDAGPIGGGAFAPGTTRRERATPSAPAAIRPAKAAPQRRWLARVWPAIELGRGQPDLAVLLAALVNRGGARPLTVSDAARLFVLGISRASGDPAAAQRSAAAPNAPLGAPDGALGPADRESLLLIVLYFATVLALLASTIWTRLRAWHR